MFRDRRLSALFTMAVLGGFTMFSLVFYAPLLFQGGFGMTPNEAGLVITPLVVFITIGSIANGRIVSRMRNPNRCCISASQCSRSRRSAWWSRRHDAALV